MADWGGLSAVLPAPTGRTDGRLLQLCGERGDRITADKAPEAARLVTARLKGLSAGPGRLADFSRWLDQFQDVDSRRRMELPGQFTGRRRPQPDYHVHVANVAGRLLVLSSKERPVRVTLRGDDAREYRYLVKVGDDLRTDQRVQQLFGLVNGALAAVPAAAVRRLALTTY